MSASKAAPPSLDMLRMKASGMRTMSWIPMRALIESGDGPLSTASRKEYMFSAKKMTPAQTKPSWDRVIEAKIMDRVLLPPTASAISPYPPPNRARHCKSKWNARQETADTVTSVIDENRSPPFLKALGRNSTPVPTNDLSSKKNVLVIEASPGLLAALEVLRLPNNGRLSPFCLSSPNSRCSSSSSSSSIAFSSSESSRSSPAKEPYRSRKYTKFLVIGAA